MLQRIYDWIDDRIDITPIWRDIADHEVPEHVNPGHHFSAFVYCFGGLTFFYCRYSNSFRNVPYNVLRSGHC